MNFAFSLKLEPILSFQGKGPVENLPTKVILTPINLRPKVKLIMNFNT